MRITLLICARDHPQNLTGRKILRWSEVTFADKEKYRTSLRIKRKTQLVISRLPFPHLIFYLRLAFLAPIGYPVICACTPAGIWEQREKAFNRSFQQRFGGKERVSKPYNLVPRAFLLQVGSPVSQSKDGVKVFFFLEWKCKGIKRRFRISNQAKEHIKKDSNRYFVEQFKISKAAWEMIRIWTKRAWNYSLI